MRMVRERERKCSEIVVGLDLMLVLSTARLCSFKKYLVQTNVKPGRFYILPKIHKTGNPGRPIVSSNSHPTERISQFVD